MKLSYPLAVLLALSSLVPAAAQQAAAPLSAARPVAMTHDDSLAVLRQVFRRGRRGGRVGTIAYSVVLPLNISALASRQATDFQRGLQVGNVAIFAPLLVNSIVGWARFSQRREREAVLRFEQRQAQPRYVQRAYALQLIAQGRWR